MITSSFRGAALAISVAWFAVAASAQTVDLYDATSVSLAWDEASGPVAGYYVIATRNGNEPTVDVVTSLPEAEIAAELGDSVVVHVAGFDAAGVAGPLSPPSPTYRFLASDAGDPPAEEPPAEEPPAEEPPAEEPPAEEPPAEEPPVEEPPAEEPPVEEPPAEDPGADGFGTPLDFTGDGVSDIVLRDDAGALTLWAMNGAGVQSASELPALSPDWAVVGNGDHDGNGVADFLWEHRQTGRLIVWLARDGAIDEGAELDLSALDPAGEWSVGGSGDFDGDGHDDIMLLSEAFHEVVLLVMDGTEVASTAPLGAYRTSWTVAATDDLDGDGVAEILWHDGPRRGLSVWRLRGLSLAGVEHLGKRIPGWRVVGCGDFDGDGDPDLIGHHGADGRNQIWRLEGGVRRDTLALPDGAPGAAGPAAVGDYDGDLRSDLLWDRGDGSLEIWFSDGAGVTAYPVEGGDTAGDVVVGDGSH